MRHSESAALGEQSQVRHHHLAKIGLGQLCCEANNLFCHISGCRKLVTCSEKGFKEGSKWFSQRKAVCSCHPNKMRTCVILVLSNIASRYLHDLTMTSGFCSEMLAIPCGWSGSVEFSAQRTTRPTVPPHPTWPVGPPGVHWWLTTEELVSICQPAGPQRGPGLAECILNDIFYYRVTAQHLALYVPFSGGNSTFRQPSLPRRFFKSVKTLCLKRVPPFFSSFPPT